MATIQQKERAMSKLGVLCDHLWVSVLEEVRGLGKQETNPKKPVVIPLPPVVTPDGDSEPDIDELCRKDFAIEIKEVD